MTLCKVIHNKSNPYVMIRKTAILDKNLSWKAKGIWTYAFSRPEDWQFYIQDLISQSKDERDSVRSGVKELEENGYLIKVVKIEKGKLNGWDWYFFETSQSEEDIENFKKSLRNTENPSCGDFQKKFTKDGFSGGRGSCPTTNPPLLNNEIQLNNETTTYAREARKDAAVFLETKEPEHKILECLKSLDLDDESKKSLSLEFAKDPESLQKAITHLNKPGFKPDNLGAFIRSMARKKVPVYISKEDQGTYNKRFAVWLEKNFNSESKVNALSKHIEIIDCSICKCYNYEDYSHEEFKRIVLNEYISRTSDQNLKDVLILQKEKLCDSAPNLCV